MGFDLSTARPVQQGGSGFDLATATPDAGSTLPNVAPAPAVGLTKPSGMVDQIPGVNPEWAAGQSPGQLEEQQRRKNEAENPFRSRVLGIVEAGIEALIGATGGYIDAALGRGQADQTQPVVSGAMRQALGQTVGLLGRLPGPLAPVAAGLRAVGLGEQMSPTGKQMLGNVGDVLANVPPVLGVHGTLMGPAGAQSGLGLARDVQAAAAPAVAPIRKALQAVDEHMPGVGAAETAVERQRAERAASLPVPIELTKAQRSRDFDQQRFERETAKRNEVGEPLRQHFAEQNERVLKNFDEFVDQTGAEQLEPNAVGKSVTDPIIDKALKAREEIRGAYEKARAAGEADEPVSYEPVRALIEEQTPTMRDKIAPVLKVAEEQLTKNDPDGTGSISLNALEDVRKTIRQSIEPGTPNAKFGSDLIERIDNVMDGATGELYKQARALHRDYAAEFKNQGVIRDLIDLKKGTTDRKTALADVFDRSVLNASLEDLRNVKRTLTSAGEGGVQAWNDLRGRAIDWIKERATSNTARDVRGNPIVSATKLDAAVKRLDRDGRLEELFGKQGAQQLRDVNDLAKDIYTSPPGAVNTSDTGSVLLNALDTMITYIASHGTVPLPAMAIIRKGLQSLKTRKVRAQVREALEPGEPVVGSPTRAFEPGKEPPVPPKGGAVPPAPSAPPEAGAAAVPRGTKRERDLVALREHATDPQVLKDLDAEIAAERRQAADQRRAAEYRKIAEQTSDAGLKAKFTAKADKLAPEAPKKPEPIPVGEATEFEHVPVGEARELTDAEIDPVERLKLVAEGEAAWRREHRIGDLDAERAKELAKADLINPAEVDRVTRQHENNPRALDREVARIIEEGEANEAQGKQAPGGGAGLERPAEAGSGKAGGGAQQPGPDRTAATGAGRGEVPTAGGQAEGLRIRDLFADNKGIVRSQMPVITNDVKPEFRAELERAGVKVTAERVPARSLKATQSNYDIENIDYLRGQQKGKFEGNPIIVSREGRVVDGHHRWAGAAIEGKPIDVLRVDMPIDELLEKARDFQQRKGIPSRSARGEAADQFRLQPGEKPSPEREAHIKQAADLATGHLPREAVDDAITVLRRYKEPPPVDVPPKAKARLEEFIAPLIERAKAVNDDFSARVKALADSLGAEAKLAPVKSMKRAVEKLHLDELATSLQRLPDDIGDLVRASIVVADESQVAAAIQAAREAFDVIRVKDRFAAPMRTGYRDALLNIRLPNGMKAELQIHIPEMFAAKELGHLLFEVERVLPDGVERDGLVDAQSRFYGAAYSSAGTGKRPAGGQPATISSNLARPTSITSSKERSANPVGTETNPPPASPSTGSPSPFSKNLAPGGIGTASTGSILADAPVGGGAIITTERGVDIPIRYRVVDIDKLITSHDNALNENPAFPPELQPRDRTRSASEIQVADIVNKLKPEWLGDSYKPSDGAPVVGSDGIVESGNARTIAMRRVYDLNGEKAGEYRAWLAQNAGRFGISSDALQSMRRPLLVRENMMKRTGSDISREEFTHQANIPGTAALSETEQATADARRLPNLEGLITNDEGKILSGQSEEFIRQFMRYVVSPNELNQMMDAEGHLSQRGQMRIRNAVFAKAYGDASVVAMLTEASEGNVRNLLAGMLRAAPEVAQLRGLLEAGAREGRDFAPDLVEAVRRYSKAREAHQKVEQYLAQGSLIPEDEVPPRVADLMRQLERDARSSVRVADMIRGMARDIEARGDPRQGALFAASADDSAKQRAFLQEQAERAGFDSVDDWAAADLDGFMRAADQWRARNPTRELLAAAGATAGLGLAMGGSSSRQQDARQ